MFEDIILHTSTRITETHMEDKRKIFHTFLTLHAHKSTTTDEPIAHLQFHQEVMAPSLELIAFTADDVVEALDPDNCELVRWLLEQMRTYDCHRQRIVGLIFEDNTVLSEVLETPVS